MESRKIFAILEIILNHSWFIRKDEFMEALGARGEIKNRLVKYDQCIKSVFATWLQNKYCIFACEKCFLLSTRNK